ncbi:phage terminase large subunit [Microbulbifer sp. CAU 1566]|uniref:phage terminase large subunit n=1 Tax=Microbulbifer sp. CAU 1566 TaxID=2933269 RepID=UPI002003E95F|nr:phage terminase large subunit [Microbulbifer sp. CAU 1566]MCK7597411.1 phage terminase large subunit [Microbulbifer sp. CAU 1566]
MNKVALNKLQRELQRRERALESIEAYMDYMRPTGLKPFLYPPEPHHKVVIQRLENLAAGDVLKQIVSMPPASAKSTYCTVIFVTWLLAKFPDLSVVCVSNRKSLSEEFSRMRRNILNTKEWQALSGTSPASNSKSLERLGLDSGGVIYSLVALGTISGFRANLIVCDDAIKTAEQAASRQQMEKLERWYFQELRTRLSGKFRRELMIGTRWSGYDLTAKMLEAVEDDKENWNYLRIPLVADSDDDPVGRKKGEVLWPDQYPPDEVRNIQSRPEDYKTQYQQLPAIQKGEWVHPRHFHRANKIPRSLTMVCGIDIALTIGRGDFTCIVVCGVDANKNVYVLDLYRKQCSADLSCEVMLSLQKQHQFKHVFCDNDNNSKTWGQLLQQGARRTNVFVPLQLVPMANADKEVRAAALRAALLNDRVFFSPASWNADVFREMTEFPHGKHDDFVDALGLVLRRLPQISLPQLPLQQAPELQRQLVPHERGFALNGTIDELFDIRESDRKIWNKGRI